MTYDNIHEGIFLSRPNRFIAEVEIDGKPEICHVKNTGRCRELLIPGTKIYANYVDSSTRSTKFDLITVQKGDRLINMDSQAPNKAFMEYLESGKYIENANYIKAEEKYGSSRFDFYIEAEGKKIFIEVKGVTLEEDGVVLFPDAPTQRGVRHVNELAECIRHGYSAHIVFVVQMSNVKYFTPNNRTHPAFGEALISARSAGVTITALCCDVTPDSMVIRDEIPVKL